jgi:hypothetical protein
MKCYTLERFFWYDVSNGKRSWDAGTRNAGSGCMSRAVKTVAIEMAKYRLNVGGPRVPLSRLGTVLLYGENGMKIITGGSIFRIPVIYISRYECGTW